jgi:hypothetical protein
MPKFRESFNFYGNCWSLAAGCKKSPQPETTEDEDEKENEYDMRYKIFVLVLVLVLVLKNYNNRPVAPRNP